MPRRRAHDRWLIVTAIVLAIVGVFMVGSASQYVAMSAGKDPTHFLLRQCLFLAVGGVLMFGAMRLPLSWLEDRRIVATLVVVSVILLVGVLAAPSSQGAHRWFRIGPFGVQPSELAKIATVILLAHVLARRSAEQVNDLRTTILPVGGLVALLALLIVIEPDLGSAVILLATAATMLFVAGLRWRFIGLTAAAGVVFVAGAVLAQPYRLQRIRTFLDPGADTQGAGFQLAQSLLAVGSGGLWGVGLGQGQQKAYYLPAAHTDFIFSVIGEEMGLIGTLLVLAGVGVLAWRGLRAAWKAPSPFEFNLALGGTCLIVIQSLVHMAVCVGMLPTKGLPLPLISYGGSSLVASLVVVGLLLNVSQHSN